MNKKQISVGIDLGTTNSLIATIQNESIIIIPDEKGNELLPSIVNYKKTGIQVGLLKQKKIKNTTNSITSIKRLLGKTFNEIHEMYPNLPYKIIKDQNNLPLICTKIGNFTPTEISSEILKSLISRTKKKINKKIEKVVITVPAYFDEIQRQQTKHAANLAGLKVIKLINEPTAAAIAYGLKKKKEGIFAVYDLGGGTFDVSILKLQNKIFEVLSTGGHNSLGGDDFDYLIMNWIYKKNKIENQKDYSLRRKILDLAIKAKIKLTNFHETEIEYKNEKKIFSRKDLNKLITPLIKKTLSITHKTIQDASINIKDISKIILVGGSTKIPLIIKMIKNFFNMIPLNSINPEKVVAIGAAIHAHHLTENKIKNRILLLDVTPLSLGLETLGGLVEKIIPRNSVLPIITTQEFTTFKNGQTAIRFNIVQGEHNEAKKCRSLGKFILKGIPSLPAGKIKVKVTFQIDSNGLLKVNAKELLSGVNSSFQIKPLHGLTNQDIIKIRKNN